MSRHLENPAVGLVGSVTNRAGNEAEIDAPYRTYGELVEYARGQKPAGLVNPMVWDEVQSRLRA